MFIFSLPIFIACIKDYENPDLKSPIHDNHVNVASSSDATKDTSDRGISEDSSEGNGSEGNSNSSTLGDSNSGNSTNSSSGENNSGGLSDGTSDENNSESSSNNSSGGSTSSDGTSGGGSSGNCTSGNISSGSSSEDTSSGTSDGNNSENSSNNSSEDSTSNEDALPCNENFAEYPNVSECHTDEIQDGDVLELSLNGGTTHFNSYIYNTSGWYCEPMSTNTYQGPERAFNFQHPGGYQNCIVTLESNCGDLSLGALVWDIDMQGCPLQGSYMPNCEWSNDVGSGNEELNLYEYHPTNYLIIVDAKQPIDANFNLSVNCSLF